MDGRKHWILRGGFDFSFFFKSQLWINSGQSMQARSTLHSWHIWSWLPTLWPTSPSPLKYLTVFTFNSRVASSSHTNTVRGCCWKADTVHMWFTPSSMALYRANALWAPVMRIITWGSENKPVMEEKEQRNWKSRHLNSSLATQSDC